MEYWQSIAERATRFFSSQENVFAECGEGVVAFVASCATESEAQNSAALMEHYRERLHGQQ